MSELSSQNEKNPKTFEYEQAIDTLILLKSNYKYKRRSMPIITPNKIQEIEEMKIGEMTETRDVKRMEKEKEEEEKEEEKLKIKDKSQNVHYINFSIIFKLFLNLIDLFMLQTTWSTSSVSSSTSSESSILTKFTTTRTGRIISRLRTKTKTTTSSITLMTTKLNKRKNSSELLGEETNYELPTCCCDNEEIINENLLKEYQKNFNENLLPHISTQQQHHHHYDHYDHHHYYDQPFEHNEIVLSKHNNIEEDINYNNDDQDDVVVDDDDNGQGGYLKAIGKIINSSKFQLNYPLNIGWLSNFSSLSMLSTASSSSISTATSITTLAIATKTTFTSFNYLLATCNRSKPSSSIVGTSSLSSLLLSAAMSTSKLLLATLDFLYVSTYAGYYRCSNTYSNANTKPNSNSNCNGNSNGNGNGNGSQRQNPNPSRNQSRSGNGSQSGSSKVSATNGNANSSSGGGGVGVGDGVTGIGISFGLGLGSFASIRVGINVNSILMILFIGLALIERRHVEAGACWKNSLNNGKCSEIFSMNITREDCCRISPEFSFTDKELTSVEYFFATAIGGGMECSPCIESCKNIKCGLNKKCVKRKGRPKCICAPECGSAKRRKQHLLKTSSTATTASTSGENQQQQQQQHQQHHIKRFQINDENFPNGRNGKTQRDIRSLSMELNNFHLDSDELRKLNYHQQQHQQQQQQQQQNQQFITNEENQRLNDFLPKHQQHQQQQHQQSLKLGKDRFVIGGSVEKQQPTERRRFQVLSNVHNTHGRRRHHNQHNHQHNQKKNPNQRKQHHHHQHHQHQQHHHHQHQNQHEHKNKKQKQKEKHKEKEKEKDKEKLNKDIKDIKDERLVLSNENERNALNDLQKSPSMIGSTSRSSVSRQSEEAAISLAEDHKYKKEQKPQQQQQQQKHKQRHQHRQQQMHFENLQHFPKQKPKTEIDVSHGNGNGKGNGAGNGVGVGAGIGLSLGLGFETKESLEIEDENKKTKDSLGHFKTKPDEYGNGNEENHHDGQEENKRNNTRHYQQHQHQYQQQHQQQKIKDQMLNGNHLTTTKMNLETTNNVGNKTLLNAMILTSGTPVNSKTSRLDLGLDHHHQQQQHQLYQQQHQQMPYNYRLNKVNQGNIYATSPLTSSTLDSTSLSSLSSSATTTTIKFPSASGLKSDEFTSSNQHHSSLSMSGVDVAVKHDRVHTDNLQMSLQSQHSGLGNGRGIGIASTITSSSPMSGISFKTDDKTILDDVFDQYNLHGFPNQHSSLTHWEHFHGAHPVCGNDGRTYNTECQLKKRACRTNNPNLNIAYRGHCKTSCNGVKCLNGLTCVEDQYQIPHCITCNIQCPRDDISDYNYNGNSVVDETRAVCGVDGKTYKSVCDINRMICKIGRAIAIAYPGPCREDRVTCQDINCGPKNTCLVDLRTHEPRCVSCRYKCPRKRRPKSLRFEEGKICGVNNRTYNSWCEMRKDSCSTGFYIDVKTPGECT